MRPVNHTLRRRLLSDQGQTLRKSIFALRFDFFDAGSFQREGVEGAYQFRASRSLSGFTAEEQQRNSPMGSREGNALNSTAIPCALSAY